jgi:hypothetical protein
MTTYMILTDALAKIDAIGTAARSRDARLAADPRLSALRAAKAAMDVRLADGTAGGRIVFSLLGSAHSAREARIGNLIRARIGQLDHNRNAVRRELRGAVQARAAEVLRRLAEASDIAAANCDACLARVAASTVSLHEETI